MLIDVRKLPYLLNAEKGCPKSQYIMADHYKNGIGVPRDREKAKYFYTLLASQDPKDLDFMDTCYGSLLVLIAYMHINDDDSPGAIEYLQKAKDFYIKNYPKEEANEKILDAKIEKYMKAFA
jgi:TPR repeat protein